MTVTVLKSVILSHMTDDRFLTGEGREREKNSIPIYQPFSFIGFKLNEYCTFCKNNCKLFSHIVMN